MHDSRENVGRASARPDLAKDWQTSGKGAVLATEERLLATEERLLTTEEKSLTTEEKTLASEEFFLTSTRCILSK
jgi:hypothetical protein